MPVGPEDYADYITPQPVQSGEIPYEETTAGGRGDIDGLQVLGGLAALGGTAAVIKGLHDVNEKNGSLGGLNDFKQSFQEHFLARPEQGLDWDDPLEFIKRRSPVVDMARDYLGRISNEERFDRNDAQKVVLGPGGEPQVVHDPMKRHAAGPRMDEPAAPTMPRVGEVRFGLADDKPATAANVAGAVAGRTAADLTSNGLLNLYWALNATQAVALLGARVGLQKFAKLRAHKTPDGPAPNVTERQLDLMSLPTATAINFGIGNVSRLPGFAQTAPDPDDPTKTADPLQEVLNRHVLNRSGKLLPWDQFRQERPDVSQKQYDDYKNYLYAEKGLLGLNALKGTMHGIDGPTITFLGKDVPVSQAVLPTLGTIVGTTLAARRARGRYGGKLANNVDNASWKLTGEAALGGLMGAGVGTAAGAVTENLF